MYEYGTLKPVKVMEEGENGGDEPNQSTLHPYMVCHNKNSLYDYYILIKMFKNRPEIMKVLK
jgi:hypothetical protein